MNIVTPVHRDETLISLLCTIWESSVRATHLFLSDEEIENIAGYIPSLLKAVPHLIIAVNDENDPIAFMGIDGVKLEMLFVSPRERGTGIGKKLLIHGINNYAVRELGVNEQNPQALGFYTHMGFEVYKRSETDEQGNPFPILYMRLP